MKNFLREFAPNYRVFRCLDKSINLNQSYEGLFNFDFFNTFNGKGDLYYQTSFYANINDMNYNKNDVIIDRLFFDFDIDDSTLKNLKARVKDSNYSDAERCNYVSYLEESELLHKTWSDVWRFIDIIKDDYKYLLLFSGSKGFHINIFFEPVRLKNIKELSLGIAEQFKPRCKSLDLAVNRNAKKGLQRLPFSINKTSGLRCVPVYTDDYSVFLNKYFSPTLTPNVSFKMKDYINVGLGDSLFDKDVELSKLKNIPDVDSEWDCRKVFKFYYKDKVPVSSNHYSDTYKCPFHDDNTASFVVYKDRFYCFSDSCTKTKMATNNWYDLIALASGLGVDSQYLNHEIGCVRRGIGLPMRE